MAAVGDPRGYYKLLGVHRTASAEEIKAAFRERAKLYHPDGTGSAADQDRFRLLREAYEALRDPQRRLHYDAEGLAAERREEQARRARDQAARGERPAAPRSGQASRPAAAPRATPPAEGGLRGSVLAMGLLALALVVALGLLGMVWTRLNSRDQVIANLTYRLEGALAQASDGRVGGEAASFVKADRALDQAIDAAERSDFLYQTRLAFPQGSADLGPGLQDRLEANLGDLRRTITGLPTDKAWMVLVEGYTGRAADASGVLIDDWELALLRVGSTAEYLVRHGIPSERVAVRFHAGFGPSEPEQASAQMVDLKLLCCVE